MKEKHIFEGLADYGSFGFSPYGVGFRFLLAASNFWAFLEVLRI